MTATSVNSTLKPNIGVYTDPQHNLYIADASPSAEDVQSGDALEHGEVTIQIRSTGICGSVDILLLGENRVGTDTSIAPMFISGTLDVSAL